jgi:hypothetical protein
MPACTRFVDAYRELFGEIRVLYATENGHEWGERQPEGVMARDMVIDTASPKYGR